jgi:2-C-methyl-D-erythritol 4-phosphate cytidylyltransferase
MRTVAVVLAGGTGQRFGASGGAGGMLPKQLLLLGGRTLLGRSVAAFEAAPGVDEILVVMAPGFTGMAAEVLAAAAFGKLTGIIEGGSARADSTRCAIAALSDQPGGDCNVLFHDAARPLVEQRIIADCISALSNAEAVGVVVAASDTMAEVTNGVLTRVLPRDSLARCQTPQGFRLSVIARAHERAAADNSFAAGAATDDCGVVLRYLPEVPIRAVTGSERNIKITYPGDLAVAETLLQRT